MTHDTPRCKSDTTPRGVGERPALISNLTERARTGINSIVGFVDAEFSWENGPLYGGDAWSTMDITFHIDEAMRFDLSGSFEDIAQIEGGSGAFSLTNLDGKLIEYSGTVTSNDPYPASPQSSLSFYNSWDLVQ